MKFLISKLTALLALTLFYSVAHSAVPKSMVTPNSRLENIEMALRLPYENRIQALQVQGAEGLKLLDSLAFDRKQQLATRWKSLTALAKLKGIQAKPVLERALKSEEWFMRNAALVSVHHVGRDFALEWGQKLVKDDALVIRTAAVNVLDQQRSPEARKLLWQEINSPKNFKAGQSLWIRRHIAKTLSRNATTAERAYFASLLKDEDQRLHPWAIVGLEASFGLKTIDKATNFDELRQKWLAQLSSEGL